VARSSQRRSIRQKAQCDNGTDTGYCTPGDVEDWGVEPARDDGVDADPAAGELPRSRKRHADQRALGGGISEHAGATRLHRPPTMC
jgi:hypothetical protein